MPSIIELEDAVKGLPEQERELFDEIFDVSTSTGELVIPESCTDIAVRYFGKPGESPDAVIRKLQKQTMVRTYNKRTNEGALFNAIRADRPGMRIDDIQGVRKKIDQHVEGARKDCNFCHPETETADDVFGRIENAHCITGANVAKYDKWSGMIYSREHHPLEFDEGQVSDYVEAAFLWFLKVHERDPDAIFPFFMWNCLEKAGASRVHGHAQVLLARSRPYAKVLALRDNSQRYNASTGRDYFNDLPDIHGSLKLAVQNTQSGNAKVFVYITPTKEKETLIVAPCTDPRDTDGRRDLRSSLYKTLACFRDRLGVHSFNVAILMPPLEPQEGWGHFPYVARVLDRGSIFKPTADVGTMELYGEPVIETDPHRVIEALVPYFGSGR